MATRREAEALRKLVLAEQTLHADEVRMRCCHGHWAVQVTLHDAATGEVFCQLFLFGRQQYQALANLFPVLERVANW